MRFLVSMVLTAITAIMIARGADAQTLDPQPSEAKPSVAPVDRAREVRQRLCLNEHISADQRLLICTSIINAPPGDPKALASIYISRGSAYMAKNDYGHALPDFDEAMRIDPGSPGPLIGRGEAYLKKKQFDQAIADFDRAIKLDPKDAIPWVNRGYADRGKGQIDRALQDYNRAIEIDPSSIDAYRVRAQLFDEKASYDFDAFLNEGSFENRAIADYNQVLRLSPKDEFSYNNRGTLYQRERKYDLALADFTRAIQLNPSNPLYIKNRAITYTMTRQFELAIADYRKMLSLQVDVAARKQIETALNELGAAP